MRKTEEGEEEEIEVFASAATTSSAASALTSFSPLSSIAIDCLHLTLQYLDTHSRLHFARTSKPNLRCVSHPTGWSHGPHIPIFTHSFYHLKHDSLVKQFGLLRCELFRPDEADLEMLKQTFESTGQIRELKLIDPPPTTVLTTLLQHPSMHNLRRLTIGSNYNHVTTLEAISALPHLTRLDMNHNTRPYSSSSPSAFISHLFTAPSLHHLSLTDIDPSKGTAKLAQLEPLAHLPHLTSLHYQIKIPSTFFIIDPPIHYLLQFVLAPRVGQQLRALTLDNVNLRQTDINEQWKSIFLHLRALLTFAAIQCEGTSPVIQASIHSSSLRHIAWYPHSYEPLDSQLISKWSGDAPRHCDALQIRLTDLTSKEAVELARIPRIELSKADSVLLEREQQARYITQAKICLDEEA